MITKLTKIGIMVLMLTGSVVRAEEINWKARQARLGREEKLRIMVDKKTWDATGESMDEMRDAGFNVMCPRVGGYNLDSVRRHAGLAYERGMFYMAWIPVGEIISSILNEGERGTKNMLGANGKTSNIFSPNSDEFWDRFTTLMLAQARISTEIPCFIAAFLDFEGYIMKSQGNYFPLSYDDVIMERFAKVRNITLPELPDAQRYPWLKEQRLQEAFRDFQLNYWRKRCRQLRQEIDAINPQFQFAVYPASGTLFTREALNPEMATKTAPLIVADAVSYDRSMGIGGVWLSQALGLRVNRHELAENMKLSHLAKLPHLFTGGIDPVCAGADPEFCGKNAVAISEVTHGYWVFYEGWNREGINRYGSHPNYLKWFTRANKAIETGAFEYWKKPREEPEFPNTISADPSAKVRPNLFKTKKPKVGQLGCTQLLLNDVEHEGFEAHKLQNLAFRYLKRYDVIILQNVNIKTSPEDPIVKALRRYVRAGGGLLLSRETGWHLSALFPQIATHAQSKAGLKATSCHCLDNKYVVIKAHKALGSVRAGTSFTGEFTDHVVFQPGPKGTVLIENIYGDSVYVLGEFGKGRVVFSGAGFAMAKPLVDPERKMCLSILDWLAGTDKK